MSSHPANGKLKQVLLVTSGNVMEAFDLVVFGLLAPQIAKNYFPSQSENLGLLVAFLTFALAFLVRPVGALLLGPVFDKRGRRYGLIACLGLTAAGTTLIAITPGYQTIGIAAPILVLSGRILQGIALGAESAGVSTYLYEIASPGREGFFVSFNGATYMLSSVIAALLTYGTNSMLTQSQFNDWGWRVPIIFGCLAIPMLFYFRRSLEETQSFANGTHHPGVKEVWRALAKSGPAIACGALLIGFSGAMFCFVATTIPSLAKQSLHLSVSDSLKIGIISSTTCFVLIPIFGALSDKVGRRFQLVFFSIAAFLTSYPSLAWLSNNVSYQNVVLISLWFAMLYSGYNGAAIVALTELVPKQIRASGFGVASTFGLATFSGFTPAIVTWLNQRSGQTAHGAIWLMLLSALAMIAVLNLYSNRSSMLAKSLTDFEPHASEGNYRHGGPVR